MNPGCRLTVFLVSAVAMALVAQGCQAPARKPEVLRQQAKTMTKDLAYDVDVQKAFVDGRREKAMKDPNARAAILQENLNEQRAMLRDPATGPKVLDLNLDVTERTIATPHLKRRMMDSTVKVFEGVPDDPEMRARMISVMMKLMKDPRMQGEMQQVMMQMMGSGGVGSHSPQ